MQRAQSLLKCERCSLLLKDKDSSSEASFDKIFDLASPNKNGFTGGGRQRLLNLPVTVGAVNKKTYQYRHSTEKDSVLKVTSKIAELVLVSGETINITDASQDPRVGQADETVKGIRTRSVLCKPVRDRHFQIIGVAQVINRIDGLPFDEHDDQLFEAFAIFCGLGINNCQLYEQVSLSAARQAVALEVLSYHSAVPIEEVTRLKHQKLPDVNQTKLREFSFNDFLLDSDEMILGAIKMFQELGLMRKFKIEHETFCRWILTVRKNYRNVPYHNWRHAFNVCQVMFVILQQCQCRGYLTDNETLALTVACLCHDLDHRGTNNAYQQ
ncbi:hypothetical protein EGW08_000856, partial [Elysia chlorotica]